MKVLAKTRNDVKKCGNTTEQIWSYEDPKDPIARVGPVQSSVGISIDWEGAADRSCFFPDLPSRLTAWPQQNRSRSLDNQSTTRHSQSSDVWREWNGWNPVLGKQKHAARLHRYRLRLTGNLTLRTLAFFPSVSAGISLVSRHKELARWRLIGRRKGSVADFVQVAMPLSIPYRQSSNYEERFSESPSHGAREYQGPTCCYLAEDSCVCSRWVGALFQPWDSIETKIDIVHRALYVTHPLYARFSCIMCVPRPWKWFILTGWSLRPPL